MEHQPKTVTTTRFVSITSPHRGVYPRSQLNNAWLSWILGGTNRGYHSVSASIERKSMAMRHPKARYPPLSRHRGPIPPAFDIHPPWYPRGACWLSCEFHVILVLHRGHQYTSISIIISSISSIKSVINVTFGALISCYTCMLVSMSIIVCHNLSDQPWRTHFVVILVCRIKLSSAHMPPRLYSDC